MGEGGGDFEDGVATAGKTQLRRHSSGIKTFNQVFTGTIKVSIEA